MAVYDAIWEDKDIRFDMDPWKLKPRAGEKVIDELNLVEDTKGNNGEKGKLFVTNLRTMWYSLATPKINLSIGFSCIVSLTIKSVESSFVTKKVMLLKQRLKGQTEALFILTKLGSSRFEFIFTNLVPGSPRLFTSVMSVHRAYESTKLYRDVKLRGSIIEANHLRLLPREKIYSENQGVWNLSSDQGNLGSLVVTNIRIVWYSSMNEQFTLSVPYIHIMSTKVRESKFGMALVVETSKQSGGYILGFRIDPIDKLKVVAKELQSLHKVHSADPILGVEFERESVSNEPLADLKIESQVDDLEIEEGDEQKDPFAAYALDGETGMEGPPTVMYNEDLGLAVEKLKDGFTIADLWNISA